jgi:hypothetical protein
MAPAGDAVGICHLRRAGALVTSWLMRDALLNLGHGVHRGGVRLCEGYVYSNGKENKVETTGCQYDSPGSRGNEHVAVVVTCLDGKEDSQSSDGDVEKERVHEKNGARAIVASAATNGAAGLDTAFLASHAALAAHCTGRYISTPEPKAKTHP